MTQPNAADWLPILWPEEWTSPATLRLLQDTPINCAVLRHTSGKGWTPMASELKRAGVTPVALLTEAGGEAGAPPAECAAVVRLHKREELDWTGPGPVFAIGDCVWPRVASRKGGNEPEAGPTGLPWVDANGWLIQLARARLARTPVWIHAAPPAREAISASAYGVAIADSEAYGARWLIALDTHLARGLAAGNAQSIPVWRNLVRTLEFFQERRREPELQPRGMLAALSDFSGPNEFLSHEFLNLVARECVPTRILFKSAAPAVPPAGVRAVVYLDSEPPPPEWKRSLADFVRAGGLLLAGREADPGFGSRLDAIAGLEYEIRSHGKGRVAIADGALDDPAQVTSDAHLLLGRRNDLLRLANAGSCNAILCGAADGPTTLQIVNYSGRPGLNPVTVTLLDPFRAAAFRGLERPGSVDVRIRKEYDRTVLELPEFSVYARVELQT